MSSDATPLYNPLDDWLLAYDEALADSARPRPPAEPPLPPDLVPEARRAKACLRLLEEVWPRAAPGEPAAGEPRASPFGGLPAQFGRFQLLRELGRGGFSVVYLALDPLLRREVALKVPRPEALLTQDLRQRFLLEARIAAGFEHPHLVPLYEAGEDGLTCYLISAYCPGPNLAAWLRGRSEPVAPHDAARLVAQLADAVQYIHDRGVLHRDIKPANILLIPGEQPEAGGSAPPHPALATCQPKLTDFGLALLQEATTRHTAPGVLVGTFAYMAPEQANSRLAQVGPHTDLHALGTVLYELLTGRSPFRGATDADTLRQVAEQEPVPPRRLRADVARDLEAVCLKCLEKSPAQRYATAAELAADLRHFLAGRPTVARPLGWAGRAAKWVRRRPMAAAWLGLLVVALSAVGLGAWQYLRNLDDYAAAQSTADRERALAQERDTHNRRLNYAHDLADLGRGWKAGQDDELSQRLERLRPGPGDLDLRGFEWFYLRQRFGTLRLLPKTDAAWCLCFSPDGQTLAAMRQGTIDLRDVRSGHLAGRLAGTGPSHPTALRFSPDGRRLISGTGGGQYVEGWLKVWDMATAKPVAQRAHPAPEVCASAVSPDGQTVAVGGARGKNQETALVQLWDVASNQLRVVWRRQLAPSNVTALCFAPSGRLLAVAYHLGRSCRFDLLDLQREEILATRQAHGNFIFALAFSPDGATLASGSVTPEVKLWDVATGREKNTLRVVPNSGKSYEWSVNALAFSPDGQTLAVGYAPYMMKRSDKTCNVTLWDVASGVRLQPELRPGCAVFSLAYAPDGRTLAVGCADKYVRLWDMVPTTEFVSLSARQPREAWSVAFSPDGQTLAVGYDDEHAGDRETLQLWDVKAGRVRANLPGHRTLVYSVAFTPDGKTVVSASHDQTLRLWDARTGKLRLTLSGHTDKVRSVACSPDGRTLVSGGRDNTVRLWDLDTGRPRRTLEGHTRAVNKVAFAPDGKTVASAGSDGSVRVWDVATGKAIRVFSGTLPLDALAYAPDGQTLATGNKDGIITLWDVATGKERARLEGHKGVLQALAYSPDGKTLASGGADQSVRLWQAATGRPLLAFENLPGAVHSLTFARDGGFLAAALHDGSVRIWRAGARDE